MSTIEREKIAELAPLLSAFIECSPEVQRIVAEMVAILDDESASEDDRHAAGDAIFEALYPSLAEEVLERYRDALESDGATQAMADLRNEEAAFSERVRQAMSSRGMTQEQLAEATGVGQPAISNILNRRCRPQRKTVVRFAEALGVTPDELWPLR